MGRKLYFTDRIMNNAKLLREHLNRMQSQAGTSRRIESVRTQIVQESAAPPTPSAILHRHGVVAVAVGSNFIAFSSSMADSNYEFVRCDLISSGGDLSQVIQGVTVKQSNGFYITISEAGTLYYYIARPQ